MISKCSLKTIFFFFKWKVIWNHYYITCQSATHSNHCAGIISQASHPLLAGFKSEWATVRNGLLYVGGLGKEWTSPTGELINFNPQWIKIINPAGHVESRNWTDNYIKLRGSQGIFWPGEAQ